MEPESPLAPAELSSSTADGVPAWVSDPEAVIAFIRRPEGLRQVLAVLDQLGPDAWRTLTLGHTVMLHVQERLAPLARSWNRPVEDATYAAFLAMRTRGVREATDPWGALIRAVELALQAETYAERLLLAPDKARRPEHRPESAPVRAGEHEEFLYATVTGNREDGGAGENRVITVPAALLVMAGWDRDEATWVCEYVASRATEMSSRVSALDVLRKDHPVRLRLGLDLAAWRQLLRLLLGTGSGEQSVDDLGLFARVLLGARLGDLIADPALVSAVRETRPDLLGPDPATLSVGQEHPAEESGGV